MSRLSIVLFGLVLASCKDTKLVVDDTAVEDADSRGDTDAGADTDTAADSDLDWATTEACVETHSGGFNDWVFSGGTAYMVYGTSEADAVLAEHVFDGYSDLVGRYFDSFELRAASELTAEERTANLFIIGSPDTQPLLAEMDGGLPLRFVDGGFVLGGVLWDDPAHGVALDHPSPYSSDAMVLVFTGNSFEGVNNTFTVMTGSEDYHVVSGQGQLVVEGDLCMDTEPWEVVVGD